MPLSLSAPALQSSKPRIRSSQDCEIQSANIVFIDALVEEPEFLLRGVIPGAEAYLLSPEQDAIAQITMVLAERDDVDNVHLISHGSPGCLYFGGKALTSANLRQYARALATWFSHKAPSLAPPSLLLYGCNVAVGDAGTEFLETFHQLTGASIAASTSLTGSSACGGDWRLAAVLGRDGTGAIALTEATLNEYCGILTWLQIHDDIEGEARGDNFGSSIALSSDGSVMAIGGPYHDTPEPALTDHGHVRVYKSNGENWEQIGADIDGPSASKLFGSSVALSSNGKTLAVSTKSRLGANLVRVYRINENEWEQVGVDFLNSKFGSSIAISGDGKVLFISGEDGSYVHVYREEDGDWERFGSRIPGTVFPATIGSKIGDSSFPAIRSSIAVSETGNTIAVNSVVNDISQGIDRKQIRFYKIRDGIWEQSGDSIYPENEIAIARQSIAFSADGRTFVVGSPRYLGGDKFEAGAVKVYRENDGNWSQIGKYIYGEKDIERFGTSVALSGDGNLIYAGSSPRYNPGGFSSKDLERIRSATLAYGNGDSAFFDSANVDNPRGYVKAFSYQDGAWKTVATINQDVLGNGFSKGLAVSNDAKIIAVGAPNGFDSETAGLLEGNVRVYQALEESDGSTARITQPVELRGDLVVGKNESSAVDVVVSGEITLDGDGPRLETNTAQDILTIVGNIVGDGQLTTSGPGKIQFEGTNTYSGLTQIESGTVIVNGSASGDFVVDAGGRLGGAGQIKGSISVAEDAVLMPGTSPGIFQTGSLRLASNSIFETEVNGTTVGSEYDQVQVTGSVELDDAVLKVMGTFSTSTDNSFVLIDNDGIDPVSGNFKDLNEQSLIRFNERDYRISYQGGDGNDVVLTQLTPSATSKNLQFTLNQGQGDIVNEIILVRTDEQGAVKGLLPTSPGYDTAALAEAETLFATLKAGRIPTLTSSRTVELDQGNLRFAVIENGSLDSLRNGDSGSLSFAARTSGETVISAESLQTGTALNLQTQLNNGEISAFVLATTEATAVPLGIALQGNANSELLDFRSETGTKTATFEIFRDAKYDNLVGFYVIENEQGQVRDSLGALLNPGDAGYVEAALASRLTDVSLTGTNNQVDTFTAEIAMGQLLSTFIIADGTVEQLLDSETKNDPSIYFTHMGANADNTDHVRLLGDNTFGFEDLKGGGDMDFDDIVVKTTLV